jgi:peptidoglycan/xylan/chitin deacetylase (PgdA/CDA1 family)
LNRIRSTDSKENRLFYAPDLVDNIKESSVDHEICTHTFTHVECAEVSEERLRWEFERVFETHEEHGLDRPVSLVPPRHSPPPRDVLKDLDIGIVRAPRAQLPSAREPPTRAHLAKDILTGEQPIAAPRLVDDVVETYCTRYPSLTAPFLPMGQTSPHPVFRTLPLAVRKRLHARHLKSHLSTVIERDSHIHLWTHLWDTANDMQWPLIKQFFRQFETEMYAGRINARTMKGLNEEIR